MRTLSIRLIVVAASVVTIFPTVSVAQNIATQPTLSRNLDRLTLLPGPTLLSPPRSTTLSTPELTFNPAPPRAGSGGTFQFVPGPRFPSTNGGSSLLPRGGTLSLGERRNSETVTTGAEGSKRAPAFVPRREAQPNPDSLRFNSTLRSSPGPASLGAPLPFKRD